MINHVFIKIGCFDNYVLETYLPYAENNFFYPNFNLKFRRQTPISLKRVLRETFLKMKSSESLSYLSCQSLPVEEPEFSDLYK